MKRTWLHDKVALIVDTYISITDSMTAVTTGVMEQQPPQVFKHITIVLCSLYAFEDGPVPFRVVLLKQTTKSLNAIQSGTTALLTYDILTGTDVRSLVSLFFLFYSTMESLYCTTFVGPLFNVSSIFCLHRHILGAVRKAAPRSSSTARLEIPMSSKSITFNNKQKLPPPNPPPPGTTKKNILWLG